MCLMYFQGNNYTFFLSQWYFHSSWVCQFCLCFDLLNLLLSVKEQNIHVFKTGISLIRPTCSNYLLVSIVCHTVALEQLIRRCDEDIQSRLVIIRINLKNELLKHSAIRTGYQIYFLQFNRCTQPLIQQMPQLSRENSIYVQ